ncbi:SDR family NAD(P)-dependent oxidoreductase [Vibrio sagamiensis]|uniref:Beta-ketoacyl-ACP reductase n=1 Tax=Vibrio sagamiensis NBRC 104589 TaxID=1219064 RepID=A0A511QDG8_9VIBR|nr:SDR family NAD(P)-dependent oxidoreductase [Vibrio sagamiensis]GEM75329.1 beta-ketoacyl-ACP reductase [Vibrio sagamiensis NBRC 104589]
MKKTIMITGCSRGIGFELCSYFLSKGFCVIGTARKKEDLEKLKNLGVDAFQYEANKEECIENLASQIKAKYDCIDILINNVGVAKINLIEEVNFEDFNEVMNVNFKSTFFITSKLAHLIKKSKYGRIINISSILSSMPQKGFSCYSASKSAMESYTKSAALEFALHGVTVNTIAPGFVETEMLKVIDSKNLSRMKKSIPLRRFCSPHEISYLVEFLISEQAGYITGTVISINGGMNL